MQQLRQKHGLLTRATTRVLPVVAQNLRCSGCAISSQHQGRWAGPTGPTSTPCLLSTQRPASGLPTAGSLQRCFASQQPKAPAGSLQSPVFVDHLLAKLRHTMRTASNPVQTQEVVVTGKGRHLGINIQWRICWRADGAFQEDISGSELEFKWGYDGKPDSCCWEMDSSGVARSLECDDHEALLVSAWVRTGMWLQPHLTDRLHVEVVQIGGRRKLPSSNGRSKQGNGSHQERPKLRSLGKGNKRSRSPVADEGLLDEEPEPWILAVRLKGGKLENRIRVCPITWEVQGLDQPLCGDTDVWQFGSWAEWQKDVLYPEHISHQAIAGSHHVYLAQACTTTPPQPSAYFQCPATPILPADTTFTPGISPDLPVWRASSGHLLVQPVINNKTGGYMVLDTGASGFVITPKAAEALELEAFGELYAASISGKIPAQFVKAQCWSLGPLNITSPVMMTMPLDGLVRGGPPDGEVIGIVGYDIFRRAVIELPQMNTSKGASAVLEPVGAATATLDAPRTLDALADAGSLDVLNAQAGQPGPLPFLQGLLSAASAGLNNGRWGGSRNGVHSSATADVGVLEVTDSAGKDTARDSQIATASSETNGHNGSLGVRESEVEGARELSSIGGEAAGGGPGEASTSAEAGQAAPVITSPFSDGGCQQFTMRLFNPSEYTSELGSHWSWHPVRMIASLPHLEVTFQGANADPESVLLMLDTGACGADMMLHARAMQELELHKLSRPTSHFVRGVGGGDSEVNVKVELVDLPWVNMAGVQFKDVKCMHAGVGSLDISLYSAGILCGDLLARLPCVFDYARKRMGFKLQP